MRNVRIILGRFQPFTKGHLSMIQHKTGNDIIDNQKVVIFVISTPKNKVDKKHPFDDELMSEEFDIVKSSYKDIIEDIIYVKSADIVKLGEELVKRDLKASVWITGEDHLMQYDYMARKIDEYQSRFPECKGAFDKDFHVVCMSRSDMNNEVSLISATKVRQCLLNDDENAFYKMMPDEIRKTNLYNDMKKSMIDVEL